MVVPKEELPLTIKVGNFKAYLNYKERPKRAKSCWDCKLEGHKRGDPKCLNPVKAWSSVPVSVVPKATDGYATPRLNAPKDMNAEAEALLETLKSMRSPKLGETATGEGKSDPPRARSESLSGSVNNDDGKLDSSKSVLGDESDDRGPQWEESSTSSGEVEDEDGMEDDEMEEDEEMRVDEEGKEDEEVKECEEIVEGENQTKYDMSDRIDKNAESTRNSEYSQN